MGVEAKGVGDFCLGQGDKVKGSLFRFTQVWNSVKEL
jgi:hypothetical protein